MKEPKEIWLQETHDGRVGKRWRAKDHTVTFGPSDSNSYHKYFNASLLDDPEWLEKQGYVKKTDVQEKIKKLGELITEMGVSIELARRGHKLGKDPKELLDQFTKDYIRIQPKLGEYWNLQMMEVMVCTFAKIATGKFRSLGTFSGSDLEFSVCKLAEVVEEYEEKRKEVMGF